MQVLLGSSPPKAMPVSPSSESFPWRKGKSLTQHTPCSPLTAPVSFLHLCQEAGDPHDQSSEQQPKAVHIFSSLRHSLLNHTM